MDLELMAALERIEARLDGLWAEQRKTVEKLNRLMLTKSQSEAKVAGKKPRHETKT